MAGWLDADSRIRYYKKTNGERGAARNYGVGKAQGEYVTFIDSDDIAYPHALQTAHDFMLEKGRPTCFALRYEVRDKDTMKETLAAPDFKEPYANEALKKANVMGCIGVFMRRDIAEALPFEEDRQFAGTEDWLLWLKLAARHTIHYNPRICYCIYQHENRSVMNYPEDNLRYRAEHIRRCLLADPASVEAYGLKGINSVYAHTLTYASLHLAMSRKGRRALSYLAEGIRIDFNELFKRRTMGIFKTLLLNNLR
jgi:glycosyltransferase involved in cell wall biosynthesis